MEGRNGEPGPGTQKVVEEYSEFVKVLNLRTYILFMVLESKVPDDVVEQFQTSWNALPNAATSELPSSLAKLRDSVCAREILAGIVRLKSLSELQSMRAGLATVSHSDALVEGRKDLKVQGSVTQSLAACSSCSRKGPQWTMVVFIKNDLIHVEMSWDLGEGCGSVVVALRLQACL